MTRDNVLGLTHAVLAGVGIYGFVKLKDDNTILPQISYGILTVNNVLCAVSSFSDSGIEDYAKGTMYAQTLMVLPCVNAKMFLNSGYKKEVSYLWAIVPAVPLICYLADIQIDFPIQDLMIVLNIIGLGVVSFQADNNSGIAAAVVYAVAYFTIEKLPAHNILLCIFGFCAYKAIIGENIF